MLKVNSSDSELEFGSDKKKVSQPKKANQKKGSHSKSKSKNNKNKKESPNSKKDDIANVDASQKPKEDDHAIKSDPEKKPLRTQVGSSFENNTEETLERTSSSEEDDDESDDSSSSSSSSSDDEWVHGYGKQAIGMDPTDLENYDGRSAPLNGSQYLMMVMNEKKTIPKVAVSRVERKKKTGVELSANYADKFKKETQPTGENGEDSTEFQDYAPTKDLRDNNLQEFSLLRSKVERWRDLLSKRVTRLKAKSIKLPDVGNKVVWLKYCYGIKFEELTESRSKIQYSTLTVNKIMQDYFSDLRGPGQAKRSGSIIINDHQQNPSSPQSIITSDAATLSEKGSPPPSSSLSEFGNEGCQPLMSLMLVLSQQQIEKLIYFHSDWMTRFGFVNKCQGEWLYALLACIDKPVEPSTMGDIRNICKTLIVIRAKYCSKVKQAGILFEDGNDDINDIDKLSDDFKKDMSLEEKGSDEDLISSQQANEYMNALNLFIYLIGDYFCQKDLLEGI